MLMYDLMAGTEVPKSFNIPFNMYVEGSYFGDSDVLVPPQIKQEQGRDGTALVDTQLIIFVMTRKNLLSVLKQFKDTYC